VLKVPTIFGASLIVSALVGLAGEVRGAPIVLKEITAIGRGEQTLPFPGLPLTSAPFNFQILVENVFPTPVYAEWPENYSPAQVGMSFFAPPDVVAGATAARSSTTAVYSLQTGGQFFSGGAANLWYLELPPNYSITAMERIVDKLTLTRIDASRYIVDAAQTIRVWGEPIPEPGTIALLIFGTGIYPASRFRRQYR
jgi:hypothetical protein